jgi:hypothetical protein
MKPIHAILAWVRRYKKLSRLAAEASAEGKQYKAEAEGLEKQLDVLTASGQKHSTQAYSLRAKLEIAHGHAREAFGNAMHFHTERTAMYEQVLVYVGLPTLILLFGAQIATVII